MRVDGGVGKLERGWGYRSTELPPKKKRNWYYPWYPAVIITLPQMFEIKGTLSQLEYPYPSWKGTFPNE